MTRENRTWRELFQQTRENLDDLAPYYEDEAVAEARRRLNAGEPVMLRLFYPWWQRPFVRFYLDVHYGWCALQRKLRS